MWTSCSSPVFRRHVNACRSKNTAGGTAFMSGHLKAGDHEMLAIRYLPAFPLTSKRQVEQQGVRSIEKRSHFQGRRLASKRGRTKSRAACRGLDKPQNCALA
jgi:hypothetical protein